MTSLSRYLKQGCVASEIARSLREAIGSRGDSKGIESHQEHSATQHHVNSDTHSMNDQLNQLDKNLTGR